MSSVNLYVEISLKVLQTFFLLHSGLLKKLHSVSASIKVYISNCVLLK